MFCLSDALFLASRFVKSRACIACMDLHAKSCTAFSHSGHNGRGSVRIMHLHEKRCIKRAGVAGIALRAEAFDDFLVIMLNVLLLSVVQELKVNSNHINHRMACFLNDR